MILVTVAVLLFSVTSFALVSVAAGQEDPSTETANNTTAENDSESTDNDTGESPDADANPGGAAGETGEQLGVRLDDRVTVKSYEYNAEKEEFTVTFNSTEPVTVTGVESRSESSEGVRSVAVTQDRTSRGESTITFEASDTNGEAEITLSTDQSIDQGRMVEISTGVPQELPLSNVSPGSGWLGGVILAFTMFVIAAWRELKKESGEPKVAREP